MAKIPLTGPHPISSLDRYGRDGKMAPNNHPSPGQDSQSRGRQTEPSSSSQDRVQLSREALQVSQMATTDRAVRDHEAAHQAAGGQYAGSASFAYQQGPDGKRYAVSGEVTIDASAVAGNPEATMKKAETVRAAALAPVDPSPQDHQVAIEASRMELQARAELQSQHVEESAEARKENGTPPSESRQQDSASTDPNRQSAPERALNLYA